VLEVSEDRRKWFTLGAVVFGLFMIMLDNTIVNVALPSIARDLNAKSDELQWVVDAYALVFGVLLLSGGKLADMFGRRRIFVVGMILFSLASLACGLANSGGTLVAFRAAQGIGAAMMNPASLSIIAAAFPPRERGRAIGLWAGISGMALAIGPLIGGLIVEHAGWNWIFFINVPIGAIGVLVAFAFIAESRDTSREQRLDLPGLVTSALGLFGLTFGLIEGNRLGWSSPWVIGSFVLAVVGLTAFVLLELHQRLPMMDVTLFENRTFTGANVVMLLVGLAMFGVFFFISLYMQNILGYSPVKAGATFLPMTLLVILVAPRAGQLSDKIGPRWIMTAGMLMLSASLLFFSRLGVDSSFWDILPALLLGGCGMASAMAPTTAAAMASVPVDKAGVGSAIINCMRQIGGSLGIAVMGALIAVHWSEGDRNPNHFVAGMQLGLHVAAGITFLAAFVAAGLVRQVAHAPHPAAEAAEPA
jgi:EmrB/QacA subfamily drug resistance transporter